MFSVCNLTPPGTHGARDGRVFMGGLSTTYSSWWFQTFFMFHPYLGKWMEMIQFDEHIFQMGRNHQLVFHMIFSGFLDTQTIVMWFGHITKKSYPVSPWGSDERVARDDVFSDPKWGAFLEPQHPQKPNGRTDRRCDGWGSHLFAHYGSMGRTVYLPTWMVDFYVKCT